MPTIRNAALLLAVTLTLAIGCKAQTPSAPAQPAALSTLTVQVTGLSDARGKVLLTLFRDGSPVDRRAVEIDAKTLTASCVFDKLPQGAYAVYLLQDTNGTGQMEYDSVGMPTKGYGMSNNPAKRPGRPDFDETNFKLDKPEMAIEVKMIYWP
ncbi:MAG: DUF2141 domain-containing protein [Terracidiphilus sp.]